MATAQTQGSLFPTQVDERVSLSTSSTFISNMDLPVHRWIRYSAGFSAEWVESVISEARPSLGEVRVFDPFCGSGTTLVASETAGVEAWGIEAHPFVFRIAHAKLAWRSDPDAYLRKIADLLRAAREVKPNLDEYPSLIRKCYDRDALLQLDKLRRAFEHVRDDTAASELTWLTIIAILRKVSLAGTAPWQYVLPKKRKRSPARVETAFDDCSRLIYHDMRRGISLQTPRARVILGDARDPGRIAGMSPNLVITSPPYPNNYDYADATRLEMTFMREINGWGDLHKAVRRHLVCSCSQHVPESSTRLEEILQAPELAPIKAELTEVCQQLAHIRETKGGRKTYHLMVASYFRDLAMTWNALRSVCGSPCRVCFVIGDSAPYGIYVPVVTWLGNLAMASGFTSFAFTKTRDRNVKWKNRKHRVPLQEGHLWVEG
jgi:hypothetical protein